MRLKDKVVVVTGGAIGIGAAIARLFAREGAKIALIDVDAERGQETCREIKNQGGNCKFYQADVSKGEQVVRIVEEIVQEFEGVDVLVNNAAIWRPGRVTDLDEETWDSVLNTNLKQKFPDSGGQVQKAGRPKRSKNSSVKRTVTRSLVLTSSTKALKTLSIT
jgi:NAD(P)-dependent dehydrogenase (short-subunit alcohol dehydrogenase family)